ncbi:MAG: type 1 glutamine amidotransferase domain-containing protein [Myxococcaceae bacterium]|jgi:putative intracellular protease/amidase|nr:type 1 glutamine amidotransferase domain-containing protein [Myxococcaceae bacterium]
MKILILLTSHAMLGESGQKTGLWLEELAVPYLVFTRAGAEVELASPLGGPAPIDPKSEKVASAEVKAFLADPKAVAKLHATTKLSTLTGSYDAVFVAGGHGTMWDLPTSADVARQLSRTWQDGKVLAAVCHGPAALVGVKDEKGQSVVQGRRFTAFTNEEEAAVGLTKVVPFLLESKLTELGGHFEGGPLWASHVVRDGRLITGQNPASSKGVAEAVLDAVRAAKR